MEALSHSYTQDVSFKSVESINFIAIKVFFDDYTREVNTRLHTNPCHNKFHSNHSNLMWVFMSFVQNERCACVNRWDTKILWAHTWLLLIRIEKQKNEHIVNTGKRTQRQEKRINWFVFPPYFPQCIARHIEKNDKGEVQM